MHLSTTQLIIFAPSTFQIETLRCAIAQIDAFSDVPFGGNPAAVCLLPPGIELPDATLLKIAQVC